jgi:hypothetical protein
MAFSWSPKDILVICCNEADIAPLIDAGYSAILEPGPDDFGPIERAGHYIVLANGSSRTIAEGLLKGGLCKPYEISTGSTETYQDLTQVAERGGLDAVRSIIRQAKSLFDDEVHPFSRVSKPALIATWNTGYRFLDPYLRWCADGEFGCFAGPYAGGKSALGQILAFDFADVAGRENGATASICAWEDAGWRIKRNLERFAESREDFMPKKGPSYRINDLLGRVHRITSIPGNLRTIDWYMERCEVLIHRENCKFFVFDPWNQHDEERSRFDTETQYVNKMLRQMKEFVDVHKVIMIVITHVSAKSYSDEGQVKPFRIAQAHGSSHFGKMADRGVCIARSRLFDSANGEDRMMVRFDKAKDEETMGKIDNLVLKYHRDRMDIEVDAECTDEMREEWRF